MSIIGKNAKGTHLIAGMEGRTCAEVVIVGSLEELKAFLFFRFKDQGAVDEAIKTLEAHDWQSPSTFALGIRFQDIKFLGAGVWFPCFRWRTPTLFAPGFCTYYTAWLEGCYSGERDPQVGCSP
jgi:hypothetical protein